MAEENQKKSETTKREEQILKFWQDNKVFEQSLAKDSPNGEFVFYDGPPFATGLPHYGHLLAGTIKDIIPRYKTMCGFHVRRRWGWDCHGLPVENLIEKELGLQNKREIEDFGVENFNERARSSVLRYVDEWKSIISRMGRWIDMEDSYLTMEASYTETIWWIFKNLYDKGLIYEGYKTMHICPRCETTLSNFEVTQGYKDITDLSVIAKFELIDEPGTYFLAWTTTPWTLPGNVALAVNPDIEYIKIEITGSDRVEKFILAERRLSEVLKDKEFKILDRFDGMSLVGKKYRPIFDYYVNDSELNNKENGWQVYPAGFVTIEDGTGIVHIAPAFGEADMEVGKENNLPFIQHVSMDGKFKTEVTDFAGQKVKPIDNPQEADIEIVKNLFNRDLLFTKQKIVHSYPHCWRCSTPLLNYATSSWFVKVTDLKDKLISENKKIEWIPAHIKEGRFGHWLEGARDWAISRSRYWGAPLPVWKCPKCQKIEVLGSVEEIKKFTFQDRNNYFMMRHGETNSNLNDTISADPAEDNYLTENGKKEVSVAISELKNKNIELIFSSDFIRTKQTAEQVALGLGLSTEKIIYDQRLREINPGSFVGKNWNEYNESFGKVINRFYEHPVVGGENYADIRKRVMEFLLEIDEKYKNKNILIVSHGLPLLLLFSSAQGLTEQEMLDDKARHNIFSTGEVRQASFPILPRNRKYELDFHRPYIDELKINCNCGGEMNRVSEVFDCWFESGAMPYAQDHYPFKIGSIFDPLNNNGFPADFIAEGLDQTRGWFYSLLVISTALFGKTPYKHVITNGLVLAEDGQKMSKSLNNYPNPLDLIDTYGADALRLYIMSSPAVRGEDLNFSEKGVAEIYRKIISRLLNVVTFYQTYSEQEKSQVELKSANISNVLDKWILIRLNELTSLVSLALDRYEIDKAVRPIDDFIDDLSTWYLRRSRERFKGEDQSDRNNVIAVTDYVLLALAKILAPFAPFLSEEIFQKLRTENHQKSVHLSDWVEVNIDFAFGDEAITEWMGEVRRIVSLGLEARASSGIKVRQPLSSIKIKNNLLFDKIEYQTLIKDELNIKEIIFDQSIDQEVLLDITISEDLKQEGLFRDFVRQLQELRKDQGLNPTDLAVLVVESDQDGENFITQFSSEIKKSTSVNEIKFEKIENGFEFKIGELIFKVNLLI